MKNTGTLIDNLKSGDQLAYRHHNPYIAEALSYSEILFTKKELTASKGILQKAIDSNLIVEIGCYYGKTVCEIAVHNPQKSVLGIDITYKRAVKSARKIKRHNYRNAQIALCDGLSLCQRILPPNSIAGICVFFPDPWSKDKDEKKRLFNKEFVEAVFTVLKPNGFLWVKTDQKDYMENVQFLLNERGFILTKQKTPLSLNEAPYETEFQKLFTKKDVPFYQGIYLKA